MLHCDQKGKSAFTGCLYDASSPIIKMPSEKRQNYGKINQMDHFTVLQWKHLYTVSENIN